MGSFAKSLFDLKFETFITRKIAGIFYAILLGLIGLLTLVAMVGVLIRMGSFFDLIALILVPLASLILVILVRLVFESSVALVTVAENTKK
jgi:hypothetical protein